MYGKIDDILKKKYDEVKIPPDIFDFDKILKNCDFKTIKKNKMRKKVIIVSAIIIIFITIFCVIKFVF